jgi:hypothetical protein
MGVQQQIEEGESLVGTDVLVQMRLTGPAKNCYARCTVLRFDAGLRLELEVEPLGGVGTMRVRSWMPPDALGHEPRGVISPRKEATALEP